MTDSLVNELRIMAEEHDDELCREALNHIELLKNANREYRKALSQQQNTSTLRDQFAMAALNGLLTNNISVSLAVVRAVEAADLMMEKRK
jgi:hypothetical protein